MKRSLLPSFLFLAGIISLLGCESHLGNSDPESDASYGKLDGSFSGEGASSGSGNGQGQAPQPGVITAGEWHDLSQWEFWQNLFNEKDFEHMPEYWGMDFQHRIPIHINRPNGQPVVDVPVSLKAGNETIWQARTDNKGRVELWGDVFTNALARVKAENLTIAIDGGNKIINVSQTNSQHPLQIAYTPSNYPSNQAEIAFVVDATGSMGDELKYLKTELLDVIQRAKSENPRTEFLTGTVFYRDTGDEYLTRQSPFTSTIETTLSFIKDQEANGGGDFPEAVHTALSKAMNDLQWSTQAKTRLLFLLLDAPPHHDDQIIDEIHDLTKLAAAKGIKIIPVTASGIDKETEFLMRFLGIITNGTYVFITNHSGIGHDHLEPSIGEYEVEYLNDLMVRLISESVK
ncbi:VWA domain-containing protein [Echinicola soli]|uniref:VWA domain-containing protein n=1 Tax=Echinicola soli TaxID=2591634 RepID=A0A514CK99_9BACT|nr:vWA domain-containing protein [Echinicola soli]QDH80239.1 VWA domain-containing protein [Echinicola soli]